MPPLFSLDPSSPAEMIALLEKALSPGHLALLRRIAEEAAAQGLPLYIIGGFVRDLFIGQPGLDFDLVVEGDAVALARRIAGQYGGKITIHSQFGTASWKPDLAYLARLEPAIVLPPGLPSLDFVTARSEIYDHPGALPTIQPGELTDDLCRRDFTINTLALRLDGPEYGCLYDELGGLEDLKRGCVRVLHSESYLDDPTRILRAVRYEQRYGFTISTKDLTLIAQARKLVAELSGERLRHELDLILAEPSSAGMLARLHELGIFESIQPPLPWDTSTAFWITRLSDPQPSFCKDIADPQHLPRRVFLSYLVWLGWMDETTLQDLAQRLDFMAELRDGLFALSSLHRESRTLANTKPSQATMRLEAVPLLAVCAAFISAEPALRRVLEEYLRNWRHIHAHINGDVLLQRGLPSGPAYKRILSRLRAAWLDGEVHSEVEEKALLEELILENSK